LPGIWKSVSNVPTGEMSRHIGYVNVSTGNSSWHVRKNWRNSVDFRL